MILIRKTIDHMVNAPKTVFLMDALGAFITAFLLFVVLRNSNTYFGMPDIVLTFLSAIALFVCAYSSTCYFFLKSNWPTFIKALTCANLLYCILTMAILKIYAPMLTTLGIAYFLAEIVIICGLVYIELKVAKAINRKHQR